VAETDDVETRASLWKAARRYHERYREEIAAADPGLGKADRRFAGLERLGSFHARDWIEA
jgi:hypothetical protein